MKILAGKLVVLTLLTFLIPSIAAAQSERSLRRLERLSEHLALSEEQVQQVEELFSVAEASCFDKEASEANRACMYGLREEVEESIEAILSSDQLEELQSLREEFGGCRAPQVGGVPALQEELGLSDEQLSEIRETMSASHDACQEEGALDARRECMEAQKEDLEAELAEILSPEQLEMLESLRRERGGTGAQPPGGGPSGRGGQNGSGAFGQGENHRPPPPRGTQR